MKNFNIFRVHWKIQFLGGIHEKQIYTGGLDSFQIQRGGTWQERGGGGVFEGGLILQCTQWMGVSTCTIKQNIC